MFVCGALLGCPAPAEPNGAGTDGSSSSSGEADGGTLGHGETGGEPTGSSGIDSDPAGSSGSSGAPVETTGAASTGETDTGCSFICNDTEGPTCFAVAVEGEGLVTRCTGCDVFAQDCGLGQKCVAWDSSGGTSWNDNKCVEVTGDGQPGDPCTVEGSGTSGVDDCAKGVMCWNVDENSEGTCVALCTGSPDAPKCIDDLVCTIANEGVLNLCLTPCDPLLQDCPGDDLCIANGDNFVCVLDASGEEGQAHDACEFVNACDKGLACLDTASASSACDPAASGCCEPFCEFPDGACPAADQKCVQWFDPMTLPMDDPKLAIGVCGIPQ